MAQVSGAPAAARRFYKTVATERVDGGFAIRLDGRTPKSPGSRALVLPTRSLSDLVAEEWERQGESINFAAMPATRLAHTALDVVSKARLPSVEGVVRFAAADLLCYFAEGPTSLVRRQHASWDPLLEWARDTEGLELVTTVGIVHREQSAAVLAALAVRLEALDDFALAGLAFAAPLFGSVVLALALRAGRLGAEQAMAAARLDEIFQEERWGVDAEAAARARALTAAAEMAEHWFAALAG